MLFFKLDPDAQHLQFADRRQTLCGIPGEAGDGFTEDLVNQSCLESQRARAGVRIFRQSRHEAEGILDVFQG